MIRLTFLLLFVGYPLLELAVLIRVGQSIGVAATLAIVIGTAILGLVTLKREGFAMMSRARQALAQGSPPIMPVAEGSLAFLAAVLLILPGLIGDTVGLLFLIPPVRHAFAAWSLGRFASAGATRIRVFTTGRPHGGSGAGRRQSDPRKPGPVIEGEYTRVDEDSDDRPPPRR
ncbi:MAG TPA: FxsA family protein [Hyphomicrobiaceae bacterium]